MRTRIFSYCLAGSIENHEVMLDIALKKQVANAVTTDRLAAARSPLRRGTFRECVLRKCRHVSCKLQASDSCSSSSTTSSMHQGW